MVAVSDLQTMLRSMQPELLVDDYVFLSFADGHYGDHSELEPVAAVFEKEGLTLVVTRANADQYQHSYDAVMACISLNVHSALEAPGLVAAFANALADVGISCNVLAGYYHDHIFIPRHQAAEAMLALKNLSANANA